MREPRSYVVRIYRQGYRTIAGTIEDTHTTNKRPFRTSHELLALLRAPIESDAPPRRRPQSQSSDNSRREK